MKRWLERLRGAGLATTISVAWLGVLVAAAGVAVLFDGAVLPWVVFAVSVVLLTGLAVLGASVVALRAWSALDTLYALADQAVRSDVWVLAAEDVARVVESVVPRLDQEARRDRWAHLHHLFARKEKS